MNLKEKILEILVEMRLSEGNAANKAAKRLYTKSNADDSAYIEGETRETDRYQVKSGRYNSKLHTSSPKDHWLSQAGKERRKGNKVMAKYSLEASKGYKARKLP